MKVEQRPVYITDDGREFGNEKEALKHEVVTILTRILEGSIHVYWHDVNPYNVAEALYMDKAKFISVLVSTLELQETVLNKYTTGTGTYVQREKDNAPVALAVDVEMADLLCRMADVLWRARHAVLALDGTTTENEKLVDDYRWVLAQLAE